NGGGLPEALVPVANPGAEAIREGPAALQVPARGAVEPLGPRGQRHAEGQGDGHAEEGKGAVLAQAKEGAAVAHHLHARVEVVGGGEEAEADAGQNVAEGQVGPQGNAPVGGAAAGPFPCLQPQGVFRVDREQSETVLLVDEEGGAAKAPGFELQVAKGLPAEAQLL